MDEDSMDRYLERLSRLMSDTQVTDSMGTAFSLNEGADRLVDILVATKTRGHKIMLIGNGGSSAVVSHVQNDLCKADGIPAMVFTEPALLTALGNDNGYANIYEYPVDLWANHQDVLIAVSSSGKSENILRACNAAIGKGCSLITFTGFEPSNPLRQLGTLNFYVESTVYGYVETAHAALTHFITDKIMDVNTIT